MPTDQYPYSYLRAWLVSVALHGTLAGLVVSSSTLWSGAPEPQTVDWEVRLIPSAMVKSGPLALDSPAHARVITEPTPPPQPLQAEIASAHPADEPDLVVEETFPHTVEPHVQEDQSTPDALQQSIERLAVASPSADVAGSPSLDAMLDDPKVAEERFPVVAPDYDWLASDLSRQIEIYKRYPVVARRNGWEGSVVVRVAIRGDGHLVEAEIEKSSGYRVLDQDALRLVHRATPIKVEQPRLSGPVTLSLPIRYRLQK